MNKRSAMVLSALLLCTQPASSAGLTTHPLTVSIHEAVRPAVESVCRQAGMDIEGCIRKILKDASDVLQQPSDEPPNGCKVGFSLKGPIGTYTYPSADISDPATLEETHKVPADVKIVNSITYCAGEDVKTGEFGCAWRPSGRRKTVIVTAPIFTGHDGILWAHEYGHTTGLLHRFEQGNNNLMTPCGITVFSKTVNHNECRHFVAGAVKHPPKGTGAPCSDNPSGN